MKKIVEIGRRQLLKSAAVFAALVPSARSMAQAQAPTERQDRSVDGQRAAESLVSTTLVDVPLGPSIKLTIERRGQVALFGLNRPDLNNRVDPDTFRALARALYDYDHDASLRAAVLFGHGDNFSQGIDVEAYRAGAGTSGPLAGLSQIINPLNYGQAQRTKPLVAVVHGDTWNLGHELFLAADIRVAAQNTRFAQDENTHGRFPGGGATIRFVQDAGWGNAMRYMLTGDHWSAAEAYRMGTLQDIAETPQAAVARAIEIANKIAACAPLGVRSTLRSAHVAIDAPQAAGFAELAAQYGALYRTQDFIEGVSAQAEGRTPIYVGK